MKERRGTGRAEREEVWPARGGDVSRGLRLPAPRLRWRAWGGVLAGLRRPKWACSPSGAPDGRRWRCRRRVGAARGSAEARPGRAPSPSPEREALLERRRAPRRAGAAQ